MIGAHAHPVHVRLGLWALAALGGACSEAPRSPDPEIWTLFDIKALYASGKEAEPIALGGGMPDGIPLATILDLDGSTLTLGPTVAEGYSGAYVTTEVWNHFDRVWVQPMYVPVTGWQSGGPQPLATDGSAWVFSVGPRSGFYSPFWQMIYVDVPVGTAPGALTSARQIMESGYPLHPGPGRAVSLVPDGIVSPPGPIQGQAWLEGKPISFLDFGKGTFSWDEEGVIDEIPLYVLLMRDSAGNLRTPGIPTVAGAGPPGSNTLPPVIAGQLRYSSFWRIYTVMLPPKARVFSPDPMFQTKLAEAGVPVIDVYSAEASSDPHLTSGWVALNPGAPDTGEAGCFDTQARLNPLPNNNEPSKCIWLSSQAAIEANVDPSAIQRTNVTVTCPFVTLNEATVSPIQ